MNHKTILVADDTARCIANLIKTRWPAYLEQFTGLPPGSQIELEATFQLIVKVTEHGLVLDTSSVKELP